MKAPKMRSFLSLPASRSTSVDEKSLGKALKVQLKRAKKFMLSKSGAHIYFMNRKAIKDYMAVKAIKAIRAQTS